MLLTVSTISQAYGVPDHTARVAKCLANDAAMNEVSIMRFLKWGVVDTRAKAEQILRKREAQNARFFIADKTESEVMQFLDLQNC